MLPTSKVWGRVEKPLAARVLLLNCVNDSYADLIEEIYDEDFSDDSWSFSNILLSNSVFKGIGAKCSFPFLDSDYARRQALLEIDVIVAISLGIGFDHLLAIYEAQFPTLQKYDRETWFDNNGRIVFTANDQGLKGIGLKRKAAKRDNPVTIEYPDGTTDTRPLGWEEACPDPAPTENGRRINYASGRSYGKPKVPDGTKIHRTVMDDTLPGGPREKTITYVAPFYLPDREEDYRIAWEVFTERFAKENEQGQAQESEGSAA